MESRERIILALDVADYTKALDIIQKFKEHIEIFKVGAELFTSVGPRIIEKLNSMDKKVFLDLKYHDIPSTVSKSVKVATEMGVYMLDVHTLGGLEMMKEAVRGAVAISLQKNIDRPKILGVTMLTSIDEKCLINELGFGQALKSQVRHLAGLALRAGLDGVVASPQDIETIRSHCGKEFLIITPGIRPSWTSIDDQKRALTPQEALSKGADYLVIGRAILSQPDPLHAFELIVEEMV